MQHSSLALTMPSSVMTISIVLIVESTITIHLTSSVGLVP
ncbi:hypothetical protein EV13_2892 [Prochlorococcus sp. MIT 0702]|nr:hypothetical protein EV12_2838 [Prochlorococcus sp. MIT 0701]KGG26112.1 hypothetical protein EV13_2892 [Prochlorococcus sp. MIT 0702]KGG32936.1 hypothetical protein EV14_1776 [Prochlorococcus sp. MIT 0703]